MCGHSGQMKTPVEGSSLKSGGGWSPCGVSAVRGSVGDWSFSCLGRRGWVALSYPWWLWRGSVGRCFGK